eukprot:scaffold39017_cov60-Phaeocystis_antarctica.AAC.4
MGITDQLFSAPPRGPGRAFTLHSSHRHTSSRATQPPSKAKRAQKAKHTLHVPAGAARWLA